MSWCTAWGWRPRERQGPPRMTIRLAEQEYEKLKVKDLLEVSDTRSHSRHTMKLHLFGGQTTWSPRCLRQIRELSEKCVFLAELEVSEYGNSGGGCVSISKFIPVSTFLLNYIRNNHSHMLHVCHFI